MSTPPRPPTPPGTLSGGPSGPASGAALTVRAVLELEEVRSGGPAVLSGTDGLDTPVRWVHIADGTGVGSLLEGGELVLSTGLTFRSSAQAAARFLDDLQAAGAAGAVVELVEPDGTPAPAAAAALRRRPPAALPVVLLSRPIRFVRVTEVVHRMLVGEQLARVERARHLHEVFTELSLQNASEQQIVDRTAELVAAPVVLEDVAHLVLGFAAAGRDRRRCCGSGPNGPAGSGTASRPGGVAGPGRAKARRTGCRRRWASAGAAGAGWWSRPRSRTTPTPPRCWTAPGRR